MILAQQRQPPRLPPSRSKNTEQERRIQLQGTCNRALKDLITIEGGSITTLGKGTIPFVLLMLMIEGGSGTTINIFFRCFVDKKGMETKLKRRLHFVMFCFLTCYIGFVNGLWSNILAAAFPLPCRFHKKGDPYCLLAIPLAKYVQSTPAPTVPRALWSPAKGCHE
uniref:Uncharacterized protein n=1 Tax=Brassica oleracea var. oleracea TaxID=109376 RepID=A0A0D3E462_BRAOL